MIRPNCSTGRACAINAVDTTANTPAIPRPRSTLPKLIARGLDTELTEKAGNQPAYAPQVPENTLKDLACGPLATPSTLSQDVNGPRLMRSTRPCSRRTNRIKLLKTNQPTTPIYPQSGRPTSAPRVRMIMHGLRRATISLNQASKGLQANTLGPPRKGKTPSIARPPI